MGGGTVRAHSRAMPTRGEILKAWRHRRGLTLEQAAADAVEEAARQGYARDNRTIPGTHASLSRWENDLTAPKLQGLGVLAKVYGAGDAMDLMQMPPPEDAPAKPEAADDVLDRIDQLLRSRRA